jgi:hypothetical protein
MDTILDEIIRDIERGLINDQTPSSDRDVLIGQ